MAVLIDPPLWPAHGRRWSHLASDVSLPELHDFAAGLGIPERGFEGDHYDVPEERYAAVVAAGALPVSSRELLRRLRASGLRRPKRRGERVLASRPAGRQGGPRVDALLSTLPPIGPVVAAHAVVLSGPDLMVLPDGVGYRLPAHLLDAAEEDAAASALSLVVALVGGVAPAGLAAARLGYLRRVDADSGQVVDNQVVLRFTLDGPAPELSGGARWVATRDAVALLDGAVAAVVAGGAVTSPGRLPGRRPG